MQINSVSQSISHWNVQIDGEGQAVVFLHGFLESTEMWSAIQLEEMPITCIRLDLPGHGQSSMPMEYVEPSVTYLAESILELLQALKIEKYAVVGHSMGGYVALELKKLDKNCTKVVLMNSNFWCDSLEKKRERVRIAELVFTAKSHFVHAAIPGLFFNQKDFQEAIQKTVVSAGKMTPEAIAFSALAMRNRVDNSALLQQYPDDFLIIQGKFDPIVPAAQMKEKVANLNCAFIEFDQTGHMAHFEEPHKLLETLADFLLKSQPANL